MFKTIAKVKSATTLKFGEFYINLEEKRCDVKYRLLQPKKVKEEIQNIKGISDANETV